MKTILIATDFSQASRNASLYGMQFAKALNAYVILFTAYSVSPDIAAVNMQVSDDDVRKQTENKLIHEADIITNGEPLPIEIVYEKGLPEKAILAAANEKEADLIIVGIKSSNDIKKLFGSITTSIIKHSNIPVILIPEKVMFSKPKTIVYASDVFLDITIQPIDLIQWMTDFFKSKLHVVRIVKDDYEKLLEEVNVPHRLRSELKMINTTFHFPVNINASDVLNDFIIEQPVDLLVMKPGKAEWMEKIFTKSEPKEMVFHSRIPILVLPELVDKTSELLMPVSIENRSTMQTDTDAVKALSFVEKTDKKPYQQMRKLYNKLWKLCNKLQP